MRIKYLSWLSLGIVSFILYLQAYHPAWYNHLVVDIVGQYISHARYFITHFNLSHLGYNEYQPGSVLFFASLSPLLLIKDSYEIFLRGLIFANIIFIFILGKLFIKYTANPLSLLLFGAVLLFTGPIVLFRFELLVVIFVVLAIINFSRQKKSLGLILFAVATLIKIYPIILIPYFLWLERKNGVVKMFRYLLLYIGAFTLLLGLYIFIFKVPFKDVTDSLSIHSRKPVHVESVWATLLTINAQIINYDYPLGRGDAGIFGIIRELNILPIWFYNYFWIVPVGFIYLWLILRRKSSKFNIWLPISLLLIFLTFSKILTPQYLLWPFLLYPLVVKENNLNSIGLDILLISLISYLSQYLYPLNYTALLEGFFVRGTDQFLFWLLALRNILLVFLTIRSLKYSWKTS